LFHEKGLTELPFLAGQDGKEFLDSDHQFGLVHGRLPASGTAFPRSAVLLLACSLPNFSPGQGLEVGE
jgi:hypothetical protein